MSKIKYILYLIAISLFFISPCYCLTDYVTNGDFETGVWTPWLQSTSGSDYASGIDSTYAYTGNNGSMIYAGAWWIKKRQSINWDNVNYVSFDIRFLESGPGAHFQVYSGVTNIYTINNPAIGSYHNVKIDVSSYGFTSSRDLEFKVYVGSSVDNMRIYLDNIKATNEDPDLPVETSITFNPDVDEYNTVPIGINYTISDNNMSWDNYVYVCEYATVNNTYDIYNCKFIQYVDDSSGYIDISNLWPFGMWISNIEAVEVSLFSEQHAPVWTYPRPNKPQWMSQYLDYDFMTINHSYEIPDPIPTPDPTPEPIPEPTIIPQPTATPQPIPDPLNESLNTSFRANYNNLVNGTINGFFEPVYNATNYFCSSLISLNDTLTNFTVEMNQSFNTSSSSLVLSASLMYIIMCAIPAKLINVMTYYLIWVVILLIFKSDD